MATPRPLRALGLVLEPGRRWWCPLLVPIQHEPTDHVNGCPLKTMMDTVEDHVTGQAAAAKRDKGWLDRMWPLIYVLAGVAFYLALIHAGELLNMWKP